MDLPIIIIVEFGQQRQRLKLNKNFLNINELLEIFSRAFNIKFDLNKYKIFLFNKQINLNTNLNFKQLENYQRFKIEYNQNEIISLKQRLEIASKQITEVSFLINSIHNNYQNLIKILNDENLSVPPGFQSRLIIDRNSQSTDEGIDHDTESISIFESAHSNYQSESIYTECREDLTIINQSNPIKSNLESRNQPFNSRSSHWNSNKVKYQPNSNDKTRLKKPINPNKPPLPAEKKKNIPCKYAAGGNCKRGSQCRFIHVV